MIREQSRPSFHLYSRCDLSRRGFTLWEMLVAVVILSVLASLLLVRQKDAWEEGYRLEMVSALVLASADQGEFYARHGRYATPDELTQWSPGGALVVDSAEASAQHHYLRLRHRKSDQVCYLEYEQQAGARAAEPHCVDALEGGHPVRVAVSPSPALVGEAVSLVATAADSGGIQASVRAIMGMSSAPGDSDLRITGWDLGDGSRASEGEVALQHQYSASGQYDVRVFYRRGDAAGEYVRSLFVLETPRLEIADLGSGLSAAHVAPGGRTTVRMRVTNRSAMMRTLEFSARASGPVRVRGGGPDMRLDAQEEQTFPLDFEATHSAAVGGTAEIVLRVFDPARPEAADSVVVPVAIVAPQATAPGLGIAVNPASPSTRNPVSFRAVPSDSSSAPHQYQWVFGGHGTAVGDEVQIQLPAGTHVVTLTGYLGGNPVSRASTSVTVTSGNRYPVAELICPQTGWLNEPFFCVLSGNDPDGDAVSLSWPVASRSFTATELGDFLVCGSVEDGQGGTGTACKSVAVGVREAPPVAQVSCPASAHAGEWFQCTLSGEGGTGTLTSGWASGWTKDVQAPGTSGVESVCGSVQDAVGRQSAVACADVQVNNAPPVATIECPSRTVQGTPFLCRLSGTDPDEHDAYSLAPSWGSWEAEFVVNDSFLYEICGYVKDVHGQQSEVVCAAGFALPHEDNEAPVLNVTMQQLLPCPAGGDRYVYTATYIDPEGDDAEVTWDIGGGLSFGSRLVTPCANNARVGNGGQVKGRVWATDVHGASSAPVNIGYTPR